MRIPIWGSPQGKSDSHPHPIPMGMGIPMGIPIPTATLPVQVNRHKRRNFTEQTTSSGPVRIELSKRTTNEK